MEKFLYELINEEKKYAKKYGAYNIEIPQDILCNISNNICLRDYQKEAFEDTLFYLNNEDLIKNKQIHLLYHMATGSGKTVIMALNILNFYMLGYRNFIFFTNQTSIVNKTKINFTDRFSSKYLFSNEIVIGGKNIKIKKVDNFQNYDPEAINICFNTIQGIHSEITGIKENSLTIEDFEDSKVVFLADEAHHFNSITSKTDKTLKEIEKTWEYTIFRLFNSNKDNVLLEFTATCNLKDPNILQKYMDKIVYNFSLKEFRQAGYTKEFSNFSSNVDKWTRTLQALIMSEFRKLIFEKHNVYSKPVVMLKSYRIADSKLFYEEFYDKLQQLSGDEILKIKEINLKGNESRFIVNAFEFFERENINYTVLAEMIKLDFSKEYAIMMNGESSDNEILYDKVNKLDDRENPYRLIFTVAKLNEGWDVLSLFDIVRLYETRQGGKNGQPSDFTMSEAQLIGRGARYFPFQFYKEQEREKKKYTDDITNYEAICETLLYHCINDSRYINELKLALIKTGFEPEKKIEIHYSLKEEFIKTDVYQEGYLFLNERIEKSRKSVTQLPDKIRTQVITYTCKDGKIKQGKLFDENDNGISMVQLPPIRLKDIPYHISNKAYRSFYNTLSFKVLIDKFPNLTSQKEFITGENYLGNNTIIFSSQEGILPTNDDILNACKKLFMIVSEFIQKIEVSYEGSTVFKAFLINEKIPTMKVRQISNDRIEGESYGEGVSQNDLRVDDRYRMDISSKDWYVYDDNKGTSEEKKFVAYFNSIVGKLKSKYNDVFLIRNEGYVSLYSFNSGDKFEPDYILILKDNSDNKDYYCVFIEPKGEHLLEKDQWKNEFLLQIKDKAVPYVKWVDDNNYKIWGTPLYNENFTKSDFDLYIKPLID